MNTVEIQTRSGDQVFPPRSQATEERQSESDFSGCKVSSDKVERGETVKVIWRLENISNRCHLEAVVSSSSCIVDIGEGENKIQLRFFMKSEVNNYPRFGKGSVSRHLSLWCAVVKGGEGKHLAFALKVDQLTESFQFQQALMTEKTVIMNSKEDRQGKMIQSVFLPYFRSQIGDNGQTRNNVYLLGSVNEICFGFAVTQLKCSGEGRYDEPKGYYSMLDLYDTA
ncbi:hypothetical protein Ocin01_14141 [Orchesella cincta]|uniref:Uncharacterized protein n=1 Tax=Orchesella cincta TaxID=48709 RepID=A0A1D2MHZ7_ORCCI|nr:hypothetical protein Ocin01_14141 [Orchesella cincta]